MSLRLSPAPTSARVAMAFGVEAVDDHQGHQHHIDLTESLVRADGPAKSLPEPMIEHGQPQPA